MYAARIRDEGPQANAAYEVKGYVVILHILFRHS